MPKLPSAAAASPPRAAVRMQSQRSTTTKLMIIAIAGTEPTSTIAGKQYQSGCSTNALEPGRIQSRRLS